MTEAPQPSMSLEEWKRQVRELAPKLLPDEKNIKAEEHYQVSMLFQQAKLAFDKGLSPEAFVELSSSSNSSEE